MSKLPDNIRYVYFDFDNVLAKRVVNRSSYLGSVLGIEPKGLRQFYKTDFMKEPSLRAAYYNLRSIEDEVEFYNKIFDIYLSRNKVQTDKNLYEIAHTFCHVEFEVIKEGMELYMQIATGYRVGILSNGTPSRKEDIARVKALVNAENILISYEVGAIKPDALIYVKASTASGLDTAQLALVDDEHDNNSAAIEAGYGWAGTPSQLF